MKFRCTSDIFQLRPIRKVYIAMDSVSNDRVHLKKPMFSVSVGNGLFLIGTSGMETGYKRILEKSKNIYFEHILRNESNASCKIMKGN